MLQHILFGESSHTLLYSDNESKDTRPDPTRPDQTLLHFVQIVSTSDYYVSLYPPVHSESNQHNKNVDADLLRFRRSNGDADVWWWVHRRGWWSSCSCCSPSSPIRCHHLSAAAAAVGAAAADGAGFDVVVADGGAAALSDWSMKRPFLCRPILNESKV